MNKVKVLFFAALRERAGSSALELELPKEMTVGELKNKLADEYPNLRQSLKAVLVSLDREYAFDDAVIPSNAEIALFPPVSGG
jgi:molybdopterin converting factor subunit 1